MKKSELLSYLFIFLISAISVFDLFFNLGRPVTFDGPTHITDIAGYSLALIDRDFPVFWLDTFGNYGMPVGFFSHQLPLTLAGEINIFLHNPVLVYNIFFFLGIFLANSFFYLFLRRYFSRVSSLVAIFLLTLSPYRITNIYIRGDLPETFSGIFLGPILLGVYYLSKNKWWAFFLIAISYFCLAITHPMMLLTYSLFIGPYLLFVLYQRVNNFQKILNKENIKYLSLFVLAAGIGVGMAGYFLIPLFLETKYLYFGLEKNHLSPQFLSWKNLFGENWFYFYRTDIAPRGQFIQIGIVESVVVILGILSLVWAIMRKGLASLITLQGIAIVSAIITLIFTTMFAQPLYQHISFLTSVQFPWRFLSIFIFLPPILAAVFVEKIRKPFFVLLFVLVIVVIRFPQLYGKNYTNYPTQTYYFTPYNLFPIFMNTIWTGKTEDYPIEKNKIGIVTGTGKVISEHIYNSSREYVVHAESSLRLVDYTFFFPGWHVYVDGVDTPIEFQDPNFRGVITYTVPAGNHTIKVILQDTSIRKVSKYISILFIAGFIGLLFFRKKIFKLFA